jgi:hypothetical protein
MIGISLRSLDHLRSAVGWGCANDRLASCRHSTSDPAPVVFVPFVPQHKPAGSVAIRASVERKIPVDMLARRTRGAFYAAKE